MTWTAADETKGVGTVIVSVGAREGATRVPIVEDGRLVGIVSRPTCCGAS